MNWEKLYVKKNLIMRGGKYGKETNQKTTESD